MKFELDGNLAIKAPMEKVYTSLTDPNFMVGTIPDLVSSRIVDGENFDAKVKVGISLVRGTMDMKFSIADKNPQTQAKLVVEGSGAGSKIHIESRFELRSEGNNTSLTWKAIADLSGLISGIGSQILKGQSEKLVSQIMANLRSKLETT